MAPRIPTALVKTKQAKTWPVKSYQLFPTHASNELFEAGLRIIETLPTTEYFILGQVSWFLWVKGLLYRH